MRIFIYADDLTGALDTGVHFTKAGFIVRVSENLSLLTPDRGLSYQVSIWNGCSRHLMAEEAGLRAREAALFFMEQGFTHYFHKVDSTLRGNPGAELFSAMGVINRKVHFLPAYPQMGRTVQGGRLFVNGVSLEKSFMAEDTLNPAVSGYIPHILSRHFPVKVNLLARGDSLDRGDERCVNLYDGMDQEDLTKTFCNWQGEPLFLSGSGGLAKAWCAVIRERMDLTLRTQDKFPPIDFLINGSVNASTTRQWERVTSGGNYKSFTLSNEMLDKYENDPTPACEDLRLSSFEKPLLFSMPPMNTDEFSPETGENCLKKAVQYARVLLTLMDAEKPETIMVIGGDTLSALMSAIKGEILIPLDEYEPGVILSRIDSEKIPELHYVYSKAGGFGEPDLLNRILQRGENCE